MRFVGAKIGNPASFDSAVFLLAEHLALQGEVLVEHRGRRVVVVGHAATQHIQHPTFELRAFLIDGFKLFVTPNSSKTTALSLFIEERTKYTWTIVVQPEEHARSEDIEGRC